MAAGKRGGEPGKRGGRTEGVEASPGAGTGRRLSLQREAGGGACVRGRFLTATAAALGRGEEDDRGGTPGGLGRTGAGPAGLPGERQVRFLSSLLFLFLFLFIYFVLCCFSLVKY